MIEQRVVLYPTAYTVGDALERVESRMHDSATHSVAVLTAIGVLETPASTPAQRDRATAILRALQGGES